MSFHRQTTCSGMLAATEVARNFGRAKHLGTSSRCKKNCQGSIPTAKWRVLMPKRHDSSRGFLTDFVKLDGLDHGVKEKCRDSMKSKVA